MSKCPHEVAQLFFLLKLKNTGLVFFSLAPALQSSNSSFSWITSQLQLSKEEEKLIHYLLSNFLPWGLRSRLGVFNSSRSGNHFCIHGWSQLGQSVKTPCTMIPQPCKLSLDNCALTCNGYRGQAKNLDSYLSCFATLPSPAAIIMPLLPNQALFYTPSLLLCFILLTQAIASVFLSLSFNSLFPGDLISSMKTGFTELPPKPTTG